MYYLFWLFFFKQKTAYEMRISDWSSDVCSSDLLPLRQGLHRSPDVQQRLARGHGRLSLFARPDVLRGLSDRLQIGRLRLVVDDHRGIGAQQFRLRVGKGARLRGRREDVAEIGRAHV